MTEVFDLQGTPLRAVCPNPGLRSDQRVYDPFQISRLDFRLFRPILLQSDRRSIEGAQGQVNWMGDWRVMLPSEDLSTTVPNYLVKDINHLSPWRVTGSDLQGPLWIRWQAIHVHLLFPSSASLWRVSFWHSCGSHRNQFLHPWQARTKESCDEMKREQSRRKSGSQREGHREIELAPLFAC